MKIRLLLLNIPPLPLLYISRVNLFVYCFVHSIVYLFAHLFVDLFLLMDLRVYPLACRSVPYTHTRARTCAPHSTNNTSRIKFIYSGHSSLFRELLKNKSCHISRLFSYLLCSSLVSAICSLHLSIYSKFR